jgi:hypothetical protein
VDDYALVVGVGRYPLLAAEGVAGELQGPDNDAQVVYDWLVAPDGGAVAAENVRMVRSADFTPGDPDDPQPALGRIKRELTRIAEKTEKTPGRRLYLYFSGHGFAPKLEEGALFTAEATRLLPEHVYAHAWLRWFRTSGQFQECVLWMDSCMNYQQSVPVSEVTMRVKLDTRVPGPAFVALAAQTRSAIEDVMSDGNVHGVFTWTLVRGLRGGACDEHGQVTAESLRNYLINVMPEFLPADARRVAAVDLQPFVRADPGIRFRRLESRPTYPVTLTFPPAAEGQPVAVWTGRPPYRAVTGTVSGGTWSGELVRALYVAEVPAAGLRHGFQVSGAGPVTVAVDRTGPPVTVADQQSLFHLDVAPDNRAAAVSVSDHRFDTVYTDTGQLHERDAPGVYKVRCQIGRDITTASDEVILLDRDTCTTGSAAVLSSPAPIPGSALSHENHAEPFYRSFATLSPGSASICVLARYWTTHPEERPGRKLPHPMTGLRLYDAAGQLVANLATDCQLDDRSGPDPVAVWERELAPGAYYLRQTLPDGRAFEGCLTASADWVTQLVLQRAGDDPSIEGVNTRIGMITDAALFVRAPGGTGREADQDSVIEGARLGLVQGRNPFVEGKGAELQELLLHTYDDPVGRIIGAHLLLRAAGPGGAPEFDAVVTGLRKLLGTAHPDVEALSLRVTDESLRATEPFRSPPSFAASWALITDATYGRPSLVPPELWQRVHAASGVGAFFVWASDDAGQLTRWMKETAGPKPAAMPQQAWPAAAPPRPAAALPAAAREAARAQGVPAGAATDLWQERGM